MLQKLIFPLSGLLLVTAVNAVGLGDTLDATALKAQTTPSQVTKQVASQPGYQVYATTAASNLSTTYVNAQNKVFAIKWQGSAAADLKTTLGDYYPEFKKAWQQRSNKANHRSLNITTQHVVVKQYGLAGKGFNGVAYSSDLAPAGADVKQIIK